MMAQAREIGVLDNVGLPYDSLDLQVKKLKEVTSAQVQEVAKTFLVDENLTLTVLSPQPLGDRKPPPRPAPEHLH